MVYQGSWFIAISYSVVECSSHVHTCLMGQVVASIAGQGSLVYFACFCADNTGESRSLRAWVGFNSTDE